MRDHATYEERSGRLQRRWRRLVRGTRWLACNASGRPHNILVELRWRLGDEVMAIPIYEALCRAHPGCRVHVLCAYPELLDRNPFVHTVNPDEDQLLNIERGLDAYYLLRSGPRDRYRLEHYAHLARVPTPGVRPRLYYENWQTPLLDGVERPIAAVSRGASWPTKRWPVAHWREVCAGLAHAGYRVVELGRGDERIGAGVSLVDRTSVREAACILRAADLFVCCDSGLMHLALAAGTHTVALFGPTDPAILIRDEPRLTAVLSHADCRGCWNDLRTDTAPGMCPRHKVSCLEGVTPEEVLVAAREAAARGAVARTVPG
ncbi:MAG: hypothetical protein GWP08_03680 [Nitrospiraceae bacterium]|nr:hypothetical protein [Nitrospiraceae bacterium]